jgi:hypothetical protein
MQGFLIGIVLAAPLAVAVYLAPKMHWYYGWPFALLCFLVSLYLRNAIQNRLLKKFTAEAARQQDQNSN